jgi:hypothetical protein
MSDNYLKIGKLYSVTSATDITVTGASVLHGIYNPYNSAIVLWVDSTYPIHVPTDGHITFPNPVAFNTIRASVGSGIISYS